MPQPKRRSRAGTTIRLQESLADVISRGWAPSVSNVAAGAGVDPSLIHHSYPNIKAEILGHRAGNRAKGDRLSGQDAATLECIRLREALRSAEAEIVRLASINLTLIERLAAFTRGAG